MSCRWIEPPSRWGSSLLMSMGVHLACVVGLLAWLGMGSGIGGSGATEDRIAALSQLALQAVNDSDPRPEASVVAAEPGDALVRRAATALLSAGPEPGADAGAMLAERAKLLGRISSQDSVLRMAGKLREALGLEAGAYGATTHPAGGEAPFDWNSAIITSVRRLEGVADGRYRVTLTDRGGASETVEMSADDLGDLRRIEEVLGVVERFPLLRTLHREAVLPLLGKLGSAPAGREAAGARGGP